MNLFVWIGMALCLSQSAVLSGLNLAFFSISKLHLELEAEKKNRKAQKILNIRKDANFLLVTILWANVAVNVLLAQLSGSVLAGIAAFFFSTVLITIVGEIIPQAFFSRHALEVASALAPLIRGYQFLLFPIAKPTALLLDSWLGKEGIVFYREKDLRELIKLHMKSPDTEIERMEGRGALNFLALDDLPLGHEGEPVDQHSIIQMEYEEGLPKFPVIQPDKGDPFLQRITFSKKKWIILTDHKDDPHFVIDADRLIRGWFSDYDRIKPMRYCHRPVLIEDETMPLGKVLPRLKVSPEHKEDDVIDEDIILLWGKEKRVITGADVLGRLMRGIVKSKA